MQYPKSPRSRLKRIPERGYYDQATIYAVLDAGMIAHVGLAPEGKPLVIPVLYARRGAEIVFHGAKASRLLKYIQAGGEVCVTVALLDGLVLARSAFHHSLNYRSAMVFGSGREIVDPEEKSAALRAISEQMLPGRWAEVRLPNTKELNATTVVAVKIEEASAKIRSGPPGDDEEDLALPVWAGVLPLQTMAGEPVPAPQQDGNLPLPEYLKASRPKGSD